MENASKALIIAGAILISIVLIGVGVLIVSNANGLIGQGTDTMKQQEIDAFNAPFERYLGRQNGSNIRTLVASVNTNNLYYGQENPDRVITINQEISDSAALSTYRASINTSRYYTVVLNYNPTSGLINDITITDNSAGGATSDGNAAN